MKKLLSIFTLGLILVLTACSSNGNGNGSPRETVCTLEFFGLNSITIQATGNEVTGVIVSFELDVSDWTQDDIDSQISMSEEDGVSCAYTHGTIICSGALSDEALYDELGSNLTYDELVSELKSDGFDCN